MNDIEELDEGSVIGNYRVIRLLGQGGMGTVYEVEHLELGPRYALKTFTFDLENDAAHALKTKFLEEGKLLARLKHSNLTHVFDLGFEEGSQMPYFVMDLVTYEDGETYTVEDIDLKDIDEEMVYNWFGQLASALDYIHGEGIVHRDIKPSNLLVDKDLNVVLTDFGISRIFGSKIKSEVEATRTMVTKTGRGKLVLGTEHYIAPEVAEGEEATPQADAYSLGVMLLRWLTGFYYGDNPGALGLLSQKKYAWLPVISRLLAPAARRPEKYTELVKMLKPNDGAVPKRPQPVGADLRAARKKRNKTKENLIAAACAMLAIGVLGTGGYFGWQHLEKKNAERDRQYAELKQRMEADRAAAEKKEAEEKAAAERKAAEEKRIAEEKAKREADRKAAELKRRQDEENAREQIARNDNAAVRESPVGAASSPHRGGEDASPTKKREFIQEAAVAEAKDYGPIPDKKYTWLANGNPDAPQKQTFLLANGAKLELMPQKAATFYMTNEPDDLKGWHKVTLTRPFWMTRTCVTVDQWREFAPNDCEDCRDVEKALDGKALLYIRLPRKSIDEFCAYLTAKYSKQLPKGYVFRLPTEAEWAHVMDNEAVIVKWDQPGIRWWGENVSINGRTSRERWDPIRNSQKVLQQFREDGGWDGHRYTVGGLSMPLPSGIIDMFGFRRPMLDRRGREEKNSYSDVEIDPLRRHDNHQFVFVRDWDVRRDVLGMGDTLLSHIVVGPDLIGEKAWENKRENIVVAKADVPKQKAKFDPKKIPNKVSKPREVVLRRVGWKVGATDKEMIFCEIPKGKFNMSNVDGQTKQYHRVELARPFWMSKFLVAADEWREYAPADFMTRAVRAAERLFPKNPVCVNNPYHRWTAYCDFLTQRYGHLLPPGYVFRLPTEAEWEWAFIADEKGDVRKMGRDYCNDNERLRQEFDVQMKKAHLPKELRYDNLGFIGNAFVGGRVQKTGFGVYDFVVHGWRDVIVLDTYDTQGCKRDDGSVDGWNADVALNMQYGEKEVDPIRFAGRTKNFVVSRSLNAGRQLRNDRSWCCAHIVIAPDILKPLKEKEVSEFPMDDFGGVFLGGGVTRADQSSKHEGPRNTDERFKRMVSRENVIVAKCDEREDTRGFHTKQEDSPWIMLDLGQRRQITGLSIDAVDGMTRHLCIWVSDDGKHENLVHREELMRKRYRIDLQKKNVKGRYIRVGREPKIEKNWFFLDKVVIYGKEK